MDKYRGRIISIVCFFIAMGIWNYLYYYVNDYPINWTLDITFSVILGLFVWNIAYFYDKSIMLNKRLRVSEENHLQLVESTEAIFNNLNQAVFQTDATYKIIAANPAWEKQTGFPLFSSLHQDIHTFIYDDDVETFLVQVTDQIEHRSSATHLEFRLKKVDDSYRWVECFCKFTYDSNEQLVSMIGSLFDITTRKQFEDSLLIENQKLVMQSDRFAVSAQLAAGIAHEVRNPLTAISGFLQLIRPELVSQKDYLDIIFSEIKRIEFILSELMVLTKPQKPNLEKLDIVKVVDHVLALLETNALLHDVELVKLYSDAPIWVNGDENQLKQVFINLVKNGIEATKLNGEVSVNIKRDKTSVHIQVTDNGIGMDEKTLKEIAHPFFTTKETGTGLGLAVCYAIVESHHGAVRVESTLDEGSTFIVVLPVISDEGSPL
ncbi:PAS domain-containing protein [Bacillus sp. HMF5848]|uniref:ATP-binding protein n=1 Tax=Bacillus sp. HMF5848 TaxID=2495421 RepID=UPI000F79F865|nr:ATP-binding protein [Bacillus sp. HMF5848]RSK25738.1 PAS domain-containing protein [Bacillus sp. HMF5848]